MATADSADLVEMEQQLDGYVEMGFDLLHSAGHIGEECRMACCEAFILALEIDCQLSARWGLER
jgi:hypothetical protein